jgi:hypothetical protein
MEVLYERLPKDLVNIIEEYAKDRTNYDKLIQDYQELLDKSYVIGLIFEISNNDDRPFFHTECLCFSDGLEKCRSRRYLYAIRNLKRHQILLKSFSMNTNYLFRDAKNARIDFTSNIFAGKKLEVGQS